MTRRALVRIAGDACAFRKCRARAFVLLIANDIERFTAIPADIALLGKTRVAAFGNYRGKGAKGELDVPSAHIWTVVEGRLEWFVQYVDTYPFRQATGL